MTVAFGADANYQARERLVLAFVSFAFWFFGVFYSRFLYYSTKKKKKTKARTVVFLPKDIFP